jgi:hypothetical protein
MAKSGTIREARSNVVKAGQAVVDAVAAKQDIAPVVADLSMALDTLAERTAASNESRKAEKAAAA